MSIIVWLYIINTHITCYETIYDHASDVVIDFYYRIYSYIK